MIAFHAIITTYGFWLPNDPRGSWSTYVGSRELHHFGGDATKVNTTRSVADREHDTRFRVTAKSCLQYPVVRFTGKQVRSVAGGIQTVAQTSNYPILALAVMPTHIHAVIGTSQRDPSRIIGHLKRGATDRLIEDAVHPYRENKKVTHSCWAKQAWKVFIDTDKHLERAIGYVENNPLKDGLARQRWSFIESHRRAYFGTRSARQAGRLTQTTNLPPPHSR